MATTQNTYTGNGSLTEYSFTFPYLEESDVRVSLDGVDQLTTAYSFANATTISFNTAPANGVAIRIYRQTAQEAPPATFFAGSAIRASDLNDNFLQQLYVAQETDNIARNLTAGDIAPGAITNVQLADNAVTESKIADLNVTTAKINDSAVTSAKIADGTIVNADVNASAAIAGTKVSPNFGSQNVVTTGSLTANGLSYPTSDGSADEVLKTNGSGTLSFGGALPAGAVFYFATSTAPTGYLKANGAAVSRTTYAALFAAVGTTYGSGDGSTTFNLPDLRGEFLRGWDDSRGVDSGRGFGSSQSWAIQNILGSISPIAETFGQSASAGATSALYKSSVGPASGLTPNQVDTNNAGTLAFDASRNVQTANETRPRNIALLACIKY